MSDPILTLDGKVINQLCPRCRLKHPIVASAYRLYKRTKGFCKLCGSADSWSLKYIPPEKEELNQTN